MAESDATAAGVEPVIGLEIHAPLLTETDALEPIKALLNRLD